MKKRITQLHTFAICAYGESDYLEECVRSLLRQTVRSRVIMCTSTPNEWISEVARKYRIPLYINKIRSEIRTDWNFAYNAAKTPYVTLAHQDDRYNKRYAERFLRAYEKYGGDFTMYYTGYRPIKNGRVTTDANSFLRAVLRTPMRIPFLTDNCVAKAATLCLGNSICCPSVTYNKEQLGSSIFTSDLMFNIDWDTFLKLARLPGRFAYDAAPLTYYRVHRDATTMEFIMDLLRVREDIIMFEKFWPTWLTKCLMKFYKMSYNTYRH